MNSVQTIGKESQITKQEEYWSLKGGMGMLTACIELLQSGKVKSLEDMEHQMIKGMKGIQKEMSELRELEAS